QLSNKKLDQLISSDLDLLIALDPLHRLEEDELNRRQRPEALQGFQAGVPPFLRPERRGMIAPPQGVDGRLQLHDLQQFLADKLPGPLSVTPHFIRNIHTTPPSFLG